MVAFTLTLLSPAVALAEAPPAAAEPPDAYRHDGFYLRFGVGAGSYNSSSKFLEQDVADVDPVPFDTTAIGLVTELALGGSPAPGVAIGGGIYGAAAPSTTHTVSHVEVAGGQGVVSVLGFFIDAYPNPKGGFHVQAAWGLGFSQLAASTYPDLDFAGPGLGGMGGLGYDFWMGRQWSLGGAFRVLVVSTTLASSAGKDEIESMTIVPGLLLNVTLH